MPVKETETEETTETETETEETTETETETEETTEDKPEYATKAELTELTTALNAFRETLAAKPAKAKAPAPKKAAPVAEKKEEPAKADPATETPTETQYGSRRWFNRK